eukprot:9430376-Lingulodinium_polyedra.AAC.2
MAGSCSGDGRRMAESSWEMAGYWLGNAWTVGADWILGRSWRAAGQMMSGCCLDNTWGSTGFRLAMTGF